MDISRRAAHIDEHDLSPAELGRRALGQQGQALQDRCRCRHDDGADIFFDRIEALHMGDAFHEDVPDGFDAGADIQGSNRRNDVIGKDAGLTITIKEKAYRFGNPAVAAVDDGHLDGRM